MYARRFYRKSQGLASSDSLRSVGEAAMKQKPWAFHFQHDPFQAQREEMVRTQIAERGIRDLRVLDAMRTVPRHEFVPETFRQDAYEDHPLPIGEEQTISQPYIVAAMLEYLALQAADRVLEIGTGSGYVTALLSLLSAEVYSVERHAQLAASAESTLRRLEYRNVKIRVGDGQQGWAEYAPFDAILVSAATPRCRQICSPSCAKADA